MDITPLVPAGRPIVQAYGDGAFRIAGQQHVGSLITFRDRIVPWSGEISAEGLGAILEASDEVEVLIVGCGASMTVVPAAVRTTLRERGIVTEPMDTGAACRTWNVLLAEDRRAAAALVAV
ncbi:MTH938/NDUFAF3 family protein [uncultured Rhodospira sp.]|uniref:Mth938-like domain-containing protein n=1 Tax=uncultured Rhodospira sp. TaxID=1936189 RepID=UPI002616036D|nr:MTH938/NDUFAF3 family protein [uncultured Rhodospira sp.]